MEDVAAFVHAALPQIYPESHFLRALVLELKARGHTVMTEVQAPSIFTDSKGMAHCICNDRIDILVTEPTPMIIEVKKNAGTRKQIEDATAQLERYAYNLTYVDKCPATGYIIIFTPTGPKLQTLSWD